jgi:hypothetical protein
VKCRNCVSHLQKIDLLERENAQLKLEVALFRRTPTLAQALKGQTLILNLTGGVPTGYKDPHDVTLKNGDRLEVKYSHVNLQKKTKTKRWVWHSVLGSAYNKKYDYLVLVGEKDLLHEHQYPADLSFVFFLVSRSDVDHIHTANNIALNTNLATANALRSLALKRHLVMAKDTFMTLLGSADAKNLR